MPKEYLVDLDLNGRKITDAGNASADTDVPTRQQIKEFQRGGTILTPTGALNIIVWRAPYACTVTAIKGWRTGGTGATINAGKGTIATPTNKIRSADLSLTSADSWMDGGGVQNTAFAAGDPLIIILASITGAVTQIAIQVDFTKDP